MVLPLEAALASVAGVERITSSATDGEATIRLEVADVDRALAASLERVNAVDLPADAERPLLSAPTTHPHRALLVAPSPEAADALAVELRRTPSVRFVRSGATEPKVVVEADSRTLAAHGIDLAKLAAAIDAASVSSPGGSMVVRVLETVDVESIGSMVVVVRPDGVPLYVKDVATVRVERPGGETVVEVAADEPVTKAGARRYTDDGCRVVGAARVTFDGPRAVMATTVGSCDVVFGVEEGTAYAFCDETGLAAWRDRIAKTPGLKLESIDGAGYRTKTYRLAREAVTDDLRAKLTKLGVVFRIPVPRPELDVRLSKQGRALGLTQSALAHAIRAELQGIPAARDVTVRLASPPDDITKVTVPLPNGQRVPLTAVAEIRHMLATTIHRTNQRRDVPVMVSARDHAPVASAIEKLTQATKN